MCNDALQCVINLKRLHLRFDIEIWAAKESHGLSRFFFLIFGQVEQRALRHKAHRYGEQDRRDGTEAGYRDHILRETGTVRVQYTEHEQQLEEGTRRPCYEKGRIA